MWVLRLQCVGLGCVEKDEQVLMWKVVRYVGEPLGTGLGFRVSMTQGDRGLIGWEVSIKAWRLWWIYYAGTSFSCTLNKHCYNGFSL